jgi:hypothetical protein
MAYNGSGTFLINTAGQPVVAGTVISSTTFNSLTADLATGLSTVITKDGQTTVTANIPMASFKFTGLGVGSAAGDSANLSQVQSTVTKLLTSVSGTDTITAVGAPVVAAYAAGQMFYFVATGDNTTSVTINIDGLGAKAVTRDGSVALVAGDIKSGEVVVVVYDGTRFQVVSQLNSAGNATFANVSITSALNVGGIATFAAGSAAAPSITTTGDTNTGIFFPAADTIAFTEGGAEALRINSSGNVGIGTVSPAYKLDVSGQAKTTNGFIVDNATNAGFLTTDGTNVNFGSSTSGKGLAFFVGASSQAAFLDSSGNLALGGTTNKVTGLSGSGTGMTIQASAAPILGIWDTSDATYYLNLGQISENSYLWNIGNGFLSFGTNNAERARITSGGALLVGTTTASNRILYTKGAGVNNEYFSSFENTNSSTPLGLDIFYSAVAPNSSGSQFLDCRDTGATRFQLRSNGGLANYSANDVNLSDERTKKDIVPLGSMWDKFKAIEIVAFKYKDQTHEDNNIGVIAQQVESVAPEFVDADGWGETPEDGVPLKTIYTTDMYHAAIKALQEAMTRIEQLEAKFAALETK